MKSETAAYDVEALRERIRACARLVGSGAELARRAGIPRRTLENYVNAHNEPKVSMLALLASAADVRLSWLVSGEEPMKIGPIAPELRSQPLEGAIEIVERWLDAHRRVMQPDKKAAAILAIYEMIVQDLEDGREPIDDRRAATILRLVA